MKKAGNEKPALDLIEEAVQILRQGGLALALPYLMGTIPFILGLLYFVADMSKSPFAESHCIAFALILALLFIWMKACHAWFVQAILASLHGQKAPGLSLVLKVLPAQMFLHSLGFIALPIAAVIMLPMGWTYAFFQNLLCVDLGKYKNVKTTWSRAWSQSLLWPLQNHFALSILAFFSCAVWLNICVFMLFLPYMFKTLFGIESQFVLSPQSTITNTTFLFTTMGLTYLCTDPFIKAVYALRCYYGNAIASGEDLKARLRLLFPAKIALAVVAACMLWAPLAGHAVADEDTIQTQQVVSQPRLEESIHDVMERPVFSWRLPRDIAPESLEEEPGFIKKALDWLKEQLKALFTTLGKWIRDLWIWFEDLFPDVKVKPDLDKNESSWNWAGGLKIALWVLLGLALVVMVVWAFKIWKNRVSAPESQVTKAEPLKQVDLMDEEVTADRLSTNAWLDLAKELMGKGAFLEALRAFYLSGLAHLAQENMISIARYKSNLEYKTELGRRARDKAELLDLFSRAVKVFEEHWYGMYPVDKTIVGEFAHWQQRIFEIAQQH
ncbi:MAG: hypothetical protein JEZ02_15915 [Desulfatibacillum sp.]|nr:hypothetical protein [Desulfatibacillum sp.]